MHPYTGPMIVLSAVLTAAAPAMAGLTICDKTPYKVEVAAAWFHNDPPGVSTGGDEAGQISGWNTVEPGSCKLVTRQVAREGQFYFYANTLPHGTHEWNSHSRLCVSRQAFHTSGFFLHTGQSCPAGLEDKGFKRAPQANTVEQTINLLMSD